MQHTKRVHWFMKRAMAKGLIAYYVPGAGGGVHGGGGGGLDREFTAVGKDC